METKNNPEPKIIRIAIRIWAGAVITFYVAYAMIKKWNDAKVIMDAVDWTWLGGSIAAWITVEGVRAYVKRRLEK